MMKALPILITFFGWFCLAETSPSPSPQSNPLIQMAPMILIFAILYFLILRPQQKKQRSHQKFLSELKRGEMVVTSGGMVGMVKNLGDKLVTLEVDENVCIKLLRTQISESANNLKDESKKQEEKR